MNITVRVFLLALLCVVTEFTASRFSSTLSDQFRALLDTSIHCVIGAWCWYTVVDGAGVFQILICGFLSSFIDIDHFIAAGSFSLKAAVSLPNRPIFHAVLAIPVAALVLKLVSKLFLACVNQLSLPKDFSCLKSLLPTLPWLLVIAWSSHQLRDSIRRGLWFWPFGTLPPTPFVVYVVFIAGGSFLLNWILKVFLKKTETSDGASFYEV
ncbi:transmembrane protein 267-like [Clavelina lepadiformis]|uniref:transmembrane protein 267-like n=1 Tax=Clavelina lepadiformis TaxID=159417 RepID=UPI0040421B79